MVIAVTFTVVCFFIVGLSLYSDPWNTGCSCALTLTGVPVYFVTVYRYRLPQSLRRIFSKSHSYRFSTETLLVLFLSSNCHTVYKTPFTRIKNLLNSVIILTFSNITRLLQQAAADPPGSGPTGSSDILRTPKTSCTGYHLNKS